MIRKLNPAVSRQTLYILAAILWIIAGSILCYRSWVWLSPVSVLSEIGLVILSAVTAGIFYSFLFSTIVRKSLDRISRLPERVCMFAFTPWSGYAIITFMVALGIVLRESAIPKIYLAVPFATMGMTLLLGSIPFFREYFAQPTEWRRP